MKTLAADRRAHVRLVVLAALFAALALAGAAKLGYAADTGSLSTSIEVINADTGQILGEPTPGGNIGYHINVSNQSTNTINHLVFTDTIGSKGSIVYLNTTGTGSCTGLGSAKLSCSSTQLQNGQQLDITVLFQTDANASPGDPITNVLDGTYAPQSNNDSNKRTDPTKQFHTETPDTYAGAGAFLAQSLLLPFDQHGQGKLTVGGVVGQSSGITMPGSTFFGTPFVGTSLQTKSGLAATPPGNCPVTCQPFETDTTIPLASSFTTSNPFIQGTQTNGYSWTFTIPVPNSFKPSGVFHTDDAGNGGILPNCAVVGGVPQAPTTAPGLCVSSISLNKRTNPNTATYSGLGVNNGHGWGF